MKTAAERLTDTKNYLAAQITPPQYVEVMNLLTPVQNQTALSDLLSIGHNNPFNSGGRRAKRALMLLAYLFINDPGNRAFEMQRLKNLPEGSETPLIAEIKSWFTLPGVTGGMIAMHAKTNILKMPKWNNANYDAPDAVRGVYRTDKPFNCYNGCVFWAFQAGAISKRYLWNYLYGKDGNAFFPIYSRVGWDTVLLYDAQKNLVTDHTNGGDVIVPAGYTVYFETPTKVFGHVACSLGDGKVISKNSVNLGDTAVNGLQGELRVEVEKMARAITHILTVKDMIRLYFNPDHGYRSVQVTQGNFWEPIAPNER